MNDKKCLATPRHAKDYLAKHDVPQLFECLMTGLIYNRPVNHLDYLQQCLDQIKKHGVNSVRWDMFLEARNVPLPPISPDCNTEEKSEVISENGDLELNIPYDIAIVLVLAGPGMNKNELMETIVKKFPRFHRIHVGRLLRDRAVAETIKGVAKWKVASSLLNSGELVPDDMVIDTILREMKHNNDVSGYVIEGYPRTQRQIEDFEKYIGINRLKFTVLIDSEEDTCNDYLLQREINPGWSDHLANSIARRIANYKAYTLPVCKHFDDGQKLRLIDGDKTKEEIQRDIRKVFEVELSDYEEEGRSNKVDKKIGKYPDVPPPGSCPVREIGELFNIPNEITRPLSLPQCPYILIMGGPGSGKTSIATELCNHYPDYVCINIHDVVRTQIFDKGVHTDNWDCIASLSKLGNVDQDIDQLVVEHWNITMRYLTDHLRTLPATTKGIIFEGFPKDEVQLYQLNSEIGRMDLIILLDCDEYYMTTRLLDRNERLHRPDDDITNIKKRISYYKQFSLPLCRYYDEKHRLNIVPAEQKFDVVYTNVLNLIETSVIKNACIEFYPSNSTNTELKKLLA